LAWFSVGFRPVFWWFPGALCVGFRSGFWCSFRSVFGLFSGLFLAFRPLRGRLMLVLPCFLAWFSRVLASILAGFRVVPGRFPLPPARYRPFVLRFAVFFGALAPSVRVCFRPLFGCFRAFLGRPRPLPLGAPKDPYLGLSPGVLGPGFGLFLGRLAGFGPFWPPFGALLAGSRPSGRKPAYHAPWAPGFSRVLGLFWALFGLFWPFRAAPALPGSHRALAGPGFPRVWPVLASFGGPLRGPPKGAVPWLTSAFWGPKCTTFGPPFGPFGGFRPPGPKIRRHSTAFLPFGQKRCRMPPDFGPWAPRAPKGPKRPPPQARTPFSYIRLPLLGPFFAFSPGPQKCAFSRVKRPQTGRAN